MLHSIRNKIIFGVLLTILIIQVISTVLQSYQVRNMFTEEFVLGTQNLAQAVLFDLESRVQNYHDNIVGTVDDEQTKEMFGIFVQIIQSETFESILESKSDLLRMQFIDANGELIVLSRKTDNEIQHKIASKHPEAKADETAVQLVRNRLLKAEMENKQIYVCIPMTIKDVYQGGLVLTYSNQRLNEAENQIYLTGFILVVVFMLLSSLWIVIFVRRIVTQPIQQMIGLMSRLANGELDQRFEIRNQDEISKMGGSVNELVNSLQSVFESIEGVMGGVEKGDLSRKITIDLKGDLERIKSRINQSVLMLSETVYSVRETSQSVEQSAKELSGSADILSSSSTKQAATIEEVSSSTAEIENHSKQNSEYSNKAKQITDSTLKLVNRGNAQMKEMLSSMDEINNTSQNVTKIIKVIDEIAFQTNLLALNAAVEAARAGKYGKGFSVVAEEVRNLAARSTEAARNTSELIESSIKEVQSGVVKAEQTSKILTEIVSEVQKSSELIERITKASYEQTNGISEIYAGISQVNQTVQQNSAIAEETAASSDVLLNQSISLQEEIGRFKLSEQEIFEEKETEPVQSVYRITEH
ncbi:HAMP domain-containing protein [bacterium]|nr:HAMP domain-containing protein [bacterium]